jgi:hypothetical protein
MKLYVPTFHPTLQDLLEEPFHLLLVFIPPIFFFTDDNGTYYLSLHGAFTRLQRMTEVSENN